MKSFVLNLHFLFHEFTFFFVPTNVHEIQNVPTHNDNWNGTCQWFAYIKTAPRVFILKIEDYIHRFLSWFIYMAKMTTDSSSELRVHYAQRCDILHDEVARNTTFYGVYTLLNHKKRSYYEYIVALSQENALSSAWEYICSINFIIVTDTSFEIIWNLELVINKVFHFYLAL